MRSLLSLAFSALLLAGAGCAQLQPSPTQQPAGRPYRWPVTLTPVTVDPQAAARRRLGSLELLAAFALSSRQDSGFGGFSGLAFDPQSGRLLIVSDRGRWFSARPVTGPDDALQQLVDWQTGPLLDPRGRPLAGSAADAEAVDRLADGSLLVAFEQDHRLWRYPAGFDGRPSPLSPLPRALRQEAPANGGLEALAVLADGRLLLLAEKWQVGDGLLGGLLGDLEHLEQLQPLAYRATDGFHPTDLAALPSGDVLLLERSFSLLAGLQARLSLLDAAQLQPGAVLQGRELAVFAPPLLVDNFEALAVTPARRPDQLLLWLLADDNFSPLQRTLLYQLRLTTGPAAR